LSGSPVFIDFGTMRSTGGRIQIGGAAQYGLLGLIHGHFDSGEQLVDVLDTTDSDKRINTGIAIVVPYYKIQEVLNQECQIEIRKKALEGATSAKFVKSSDTNVFGANAKSSDCT